jgi:uncharacterized caspase-like protein
MHHGCFCGWRRAWPVVAALAIFVPLLLSSAPLGTIDSHEPRVALVVGNAAYSRPGEKLANPCRDARAIGEVLRSRLRFEVTDACDVSRKLVDACRDNPLPAGTKGGTKGLARVDSKAGTIVGFAIRAEATAQDGAGPHSPYAQALLGPMPGSPCRTT